MNKHHWQIVVLVASAVALHFAAFHDWADAFRPASVAGFCATLAAVAKALYTEKPDPQ